MTSRRQLLKIGTLSILGSTLALPTSLSGTCFPAPNAGEKKFLKACRQGKIETVKTLLAAQPELRNAKNEAGHSAFAVALLAGHTPIGVLLQEAGYLPDLHESALALDWERFEHLLADKKEEAQQLVNADHPVGGTAMWCAAAGGAGTSSWRVYAQCGDPDSNPKGKKGTAPLQQALRYPDLAVAELTAATLLSNAANPNPADNADLPPLHIAAERGSYTLVEMLIRLGARIDQKDIRGRTAAQLAEKNGRQKVWELLQDHQQIGRTVWSSRIAIRADGSTYQRPPLEGIPCHRQSNLVGMSHFNLEGVKKELAEDPMLAHSIATTGERAVEACAHTGRKPIVEFLLERGAPCALTTAIMLNDFTLVNRLLNEDPNRIHERGAHDFALLWYPVIGKCDLEMTQLLLDRGAKVEEQHFLGTTALHWACRANDADLVNLLLENGADPNRIGRKFKPEGQKPEEMTEEGKIVELLHTFKGER